MVVYNFLTHSDNREGMARETGNLSQHWNYYRKFGGKTFIAYLYQVVGINLFGPDGDILPPYCGDQVTYLRP